MTPQDIQTLLRAVPFVPFRIYLSDGKTYDIEHPEFVWVFRSRIEIARATPGALYFEDSDFVALIHIVRMEQPITQGKAS